MHYRNKIFYGSWSLIRSLRSTTSRSKLDRADVQVSRGCSDLLLHMSSLQHLGYLKRSSTKPCTAYWPRVADVCHNRQARRGCTSYYCARSEPGSARQYRRCCSGIQDSPGPTIAWDRLSSFPDHNHTLREVDLATSNSNSAVMLRRRVCHDTFVLVSFTHFQY